MVYDRLGLKRDQLVCAFSFTNSTGLRPNLARQAVRSVGHDLIGR